MDSESGYGVEPHEVAAVWDNVVGEQEPGDADERWFVHLSSRQALLDATSKRIADERAFTARRIYEQMGTDRSYEKLGQALGLSRTKAQQLIERSRLQRGGSEKTSTTVQLPDFGAAPAPHTDGYKTIQIDMPPRR